MNSEVYQQLQSLHQQSMKLFYTHQNGAHPYDEYELLLQLVAEHAPKTIFEAGTGYGVSTAALALGSAETKVISVDKNKPVLDTASQFFDTFGITDRIDLVHDEFKPFLSKQEDNSYDMVFFDGFAPGLSTFLELERVLKKDGLMVCANLKLRGDKRKITARMNDSTFYSGSQTLEDTVYGKKV
jgi:predicted O-methyltransferase YrrM